MDQRFVSKWREERGREIILKQVIYFIVGHKTSFLKLTMILFLFFSDLDKSSNMTLGCSFSGPN